MVILESAGVYQFDLIALRDCELLQKRTNRNSRAVFNYVLAALLTLAADKPTFRNHLVRVREVERVKLTAEVRTSEVLLML